VRTTCSERSRSSRPGASPSSSSSASVGALGRGPSRPSTGRREPTYADQSARSEVGVTRRPGVTSLSHAPATPCAATTSSTLRVVWKRASFEMRGLA
jgi:hypothetical protein